MNTIQNSLPHLKTILLNVSQKMKAEVAIFNKEKNKDDYEDIYLENDYEDSGMMLTNVITQLQSCQMNSFMRQKMDSLMKELDLLKKNITDREQELKNKEIYRDEILEKYDVEAKEEIRKYIDFENSLIVEIPHHMFSEEDKSLIIDLMKKNGFEKLKESDLNKFHFLGTIEDQDKIKKLKHFLYDWIKDVVNDRNFIGSMSVKKITIDNLCRRLI